MADFGPSLSDAVLEADDDLAGQILLQFTRLLRIASVHRLENQALRAAVQDFTTLLDRAFDRVPLVRLQAVEGALYFNGEFLKVKGGLYESAERLKEMFERLAVDDVAISDRLEPPELQAFLTAFQSAMQSAEPQAFVSSRFSKIEVRASRRQQGMDVDARLELARTYAQLVVLLREADAAMSQAQLFSLARIRRAVQQMVDASRDLEALLAGLVLFDAPERGASEHGAAVVALTLRMGRQLGLRRKELANLGMAAALQDLGTADGDPRVQALSRALAMAPWTSTLEALDRASVSFERTLPARGRAGWPLPRASAMIIAVADAYARLVLPLDGSRGLSPARAVAVLGQNQEGFFDPRILRLFVAAVGTLPVGSMVRLSDGRQAVVVDVPAGSAKPTVRVVSSDPGGSHLVDLNTGSIRVAQVLEASEVEAPVVPYLLA